MEMVCYQLPSYCDQVYVCLHRMFSAILITGGYNDGILQSAEVFLPSTSTSCELPGLVEGRYYHTQEGLLLCGAFEGGAGHSCEEFSPGTGTWATTSHILEEERHNHVSWSVEEGTILMGGYYSQTTSEIEKHDGTTETSFDMRYNTEYETIQYSF